MIPVPSLSQSFWVLCRVPSGPFNLHSLAGAVPLFQWAIPGDPHLLFQWYSPQPLTTGVFSPRRLPSQAGSLLSGSWQILQVPHRAPNSHATVSPHQRRICFLSAG